MFSLFLHHQDDEALMSSLCVFDMRVLCFCEEIMKPTCQLCVCVWLGWSGLSSSVSQLFCLLLFKDDKVVSFLCVWDARTRGFGFQTRKKGFSEETGEGWEDKREEVGEKGGETGKV